MNLLHPPGEVFLIDQAAPDHRMRQRQKLSLRERDVRVKRLGELVFLLPPLKQRKRTGLGGSPSHVASRLIFQGVGVGHAVLRPDRPLPAVGPDRLDQGDGGQVDPRSPFSAPVSFLVEALMVRSLNLKD